MNCDYEPNISAEEFLELMIKSRGTDDVVILDIRTADEYEVYHLEGAINIDFYDEKFDEYLDELDKEKTHMIYCRTGRRTGTAENHALGRMLKKGFSRVHNMLGGIHAFVKVPGADDVIE